MKSENIHFIGVSEGECIKNFFKDIMMKIYLNQMKKKDTQMQEVQRILKKVNS